MDMDMDMEIFFMATTAAETSSRDITWSLASRSRWKYHSAISTTIKQSWPSWIEHSTSPSAPSRQLRWFAVASSQKLCLAVDRNKYSGCPRLECNASSLLSQAHSFVNAFRNLNSAQPPFTMTIIHIVLFKFKADASAEAIESARKELLNLQSLLPNHISKISFGKSFTDRHKGFEYVLTVEMPSRQALAEYSPHPEHQRVVKSHIMPILDDIMAVDYEV